MGCPSARIWWQFRVKVDAYLDIAEAEVKSFQKSLEELARYNECKSVFASLMSTYTRSNWTQIVPKFFDSLDYFDFLGLNELLGFPWSLNSLLQPVGSKCRSREV